MLALLLSLEVYQTGLDILNSNIQAKVTQLLASRRIPPERGTSMASSPAPNKIPQLGPVLIWVTTKVHIHIRRKKHI